MHKLGDWLRHIFWNLYEGPFVAQYPSLLKKAVGDCESVLDLGCGKGLQMKRSGIEARRKVGIEIFAADAENARESGVYDEVITADILSAGQKFPPKSFDVVMCSDVIEHLPKEKGLELIEMMSRLAKRRVVVFTPNGFFEQHPTADGNKKQEHVSAWTADEMKRLGFDRIYGIHGLKGLGKHYPGALAKPYWFWRGLASWTQPLVLHRPEWAFQILCVKSV